MATKRVETLIVDFASNIPNLEFEKALFGLYTFQAKQHKPNRCDISMRLIAPYDDIDGEFIVGLVITSRKGGAPPKHNTETGATEALGLGEDEGLGYANVFLYEKRRHMLMYEFNKNGTYLSQFIDFVQTKTIEITNNEEETDSLFCVSLELNPLLRSEAYARMLGIGIYRSLEIVIANPVEFMQFVDHGTVQGKALLDLTSSSISLDSPRYKANFTCGHEITTSLSTGGFRRIIDALRYGMTTLHGHNIEKIKLKGYYQDSESGTVLQPIDLLADRYIKTFNLPEPREFTDFQEGQRREQIVYLYKSCLNELSRLI